MHGQPSTSPVTQLFVNSAPAPGLTSSLNSMVVHVVEARATAEVGVVSPLRPPMPRVGVDATRLAIDVPFGGGRGHAYARDVGVQVDVCPLQSQRLTDAHPRAEQQKHHLVQVARSSGATQQQATLVASNTVLMGSRQLKQVASLLDREGLHCAPSPR